MGTTVNPLPDGRGFHEFGRLVNENVLWSVTEMPRRRPTGGGIISHTPFLERVPIFDRLTSTADRRPAGGGLVSHPPCPLPSPIRPASIRTLV